MIITAGDFEGFIAAFVNNLVQLLILAAALLSVSGLLHAFKFTEGDTLVDLPLLELLNGGFEGDWAALFPAWRFALAYLLVAVILLGARWFAHPVSGNV